MSYRTYFAPGANNVFCQICNKKMKSFEMFKRYDGVLCCEVCWNPRHPQEYPPRIQPEMPPKIVAPEPAGITLPYCELFHRQMIPGIWYGGCALPGSSFGSGVSAVLVDDPDTFTFEDD
jgi:hypothetical protein